MQNDLEKQMEKLRRECEERRHRLEEAKNLHEYLREADDLEQFIAEQMQIASSEDYGQDYEHLQVTNYLVCQIHKQKLCLLV